MSGHVINDYIAGALGGAAGLVVGHPFDTTKVQLQTKQASSPYKGTWDAIRNINKQGWTKGFFRGLSFPLASYGLVNSVYFGVYGHTLRILTGDKLRKPNYGEIFAAGCAGGFAQLFVACPVDVVKVILQSQIPHSSAGSVAPSSARTAHYKGPIQCLAGVYRQHGIKGCFRGFCTMGVRDVPTFGLYVVVYESLYSILSKSKMTDNQGIVSNLIAGGCAGVACWSLVIPADVIKSQLQADLAKKDASGKSAWFYIHRTYQQHGFRGFFTGLQVTFVRAFIVNAVTFLAYAQMLRYLDDLYDRRQARNMHQKEDI